MCNRKEKYYLEKLMGVCNRASKRALGKVPPGKVIDLKYEQKQLIGKGEENVQSPNRDPDKSGNRTEARQFRVRKDGEKEP